MKTGYLTAPDGLRLYYELHEPTSVFEARTAATTPAGEDRPRAGILLVHGYTDHAERLRFLAERLVAASYTVMAFDFRGRGRSEGRRGHCNHFEDYVADLETALVKLRELVPNVPFGIIAQSHGALVALQLLSQPDRRPRQVRGAILGSPYLGLALPVPAFKTVLARLTSSIVPWLSLPNGMKGADNTRDEAAAHSYDTDPLVHRVATARWFTE